MPPYDFVIAEFVAALRTALGALPEGGLDAFAARVRRDELSPRGELPSGVRYEVRGRGAAGLLRDG